MSVQKGNKKSKKLKIIGRYNIYKYNDMMKVRELIDNGAKVVKDDLETVTIAG